MRLERHPFKVIHFGEIPRINKTLLLNGILKYKLYHAPVKNNKRPIMIRWTYRVSNEKQELFSYIGESYGAIIINGEQVLDDEINQYVAALRLQFEFTWSDKTSGTPLNGTTVPAVNQKEADYFLRSIRELL